ncbi:unnamed protein product [Cercopithifilaria johnstoni]|uniref:Uncharacterized protein n=1 Tax=Cercopithifilaria johnstoni TaxID=2874296 RepID=A0A8J2M545_9BILA|nr:unnamed protein product [Cercopithifilaria johnstoni]
MTSTSKHKHVRFDCSCSSSAITTTITTITNTVITDSIATATITSLSAQPVSSLFFQNYPRSSIQNNLQNASQEYLSSLCSSSSNPTIKETSLPSIFPLSLSFLSRKYYQQTYSRRNSLLPNSALPQQHQTKSIIRNSHTFTKTADHPSENTSSSILHLNTQSLSSISPLLQVTTIPSYHTNNMKNPSTLDTIKVSRSKSQSYQVDF